MIPAVLTKKILRFIQEHYSSILTLEGLSAAFHMSEGQFCRFFKSQVHMTLIEYINYYRIGAACDQLLSGSEPVSSIATGCGYSISAISTACSENTCTAPRKSTGKLTARLRCKNES